jgi:MFS transporter, Spinster family, sphingosine-1-phosphate transporter
VILDVVPAGVRATAVSMFALGQNLMGLAVGPVVTARSPTGGGLAAALATVAVLGVPAGMVLWCSSVSGP